LKLYEQKFYIGLQKSFLYELENVLQESPLLSACVRNDVKAQHDNHFLSILCM